MNDYKSSRNREDIDIQEAGPGPPGSCIPVTQYSAALAFTASRRQIQAEWNRYIGSLIV